MFVVSNLEKLVSELEDGHIKEKLISELNLAKEQIRTRKYDVLQDFVVYTGKDKMELIIDIHILSLIQC